MLESPNGLQVMVVDVNNMRPIRQIKAGAFKLVENMLDILV